MNILVKNNAFGLLAAVVSYMDTGVQLQPGDGGNFPNVGGVSATIDDSTFNPIIKTTGHLRTFASI